MISVLYVDDEPGLLELVKMYLERDGPFTVDTVASAQAALSLLDEKKYDVIIADYMMPDMDGILFLKKVRSLGNTIPFILFTGRGREEVIIQAIDEGADFYIQKGGDPTTQFTELSHKIQQAVHKRLAKKQLLESQAQLRTIVDSINAGIVIIDAKTHRILNTNPKAIEMIGADADEITGQVCHRFICPAQAGSCPVTDCGQHIDLSERVLLNKKGETIPILKSVISAVLNGNDVLIESFFDISEQKRSEEEVRQKNARLVTISELEREFAELPYGRRVEELAAKKLLTMTGAVVSTFNTYDPVAQVLRPAIIEVAPGILESLPGAWENLTRLLGIKPEDIVIPVSKEQYQDIHRSTVGIVKTVTEISHGKIPPLVSASILKLSGIDRFILVSHIIDGELYGTSVIGLRPDRPDPPGELLDLYGHIIAASLRRQRAEVALRRSEKKYRDIIDNMQDVVFRTDREGKLIMFSPAGLKLAGYDSEEEMLGFDVAFDIYQDPEDRNRFLAALKEKGRVENYPLIMKGKHGVPHLVTASSHFYYDDNGNVLGVEGLLHDITEISKKEQELRASEERFRTLYHDNPIMLFTLDAKGTVISVNQSGASQLGYTINELEGKPVLNVFYPEDHHAVTESLQTCIASPKKEFHWQFRKVKKDGSLIWVDEYARAIVNSFKELNVLVVCQDITEGKTAEEALRESEEKFRSFVETSRDIIWEMDRQGIFRYVSPQVQQIMGYTPEEIIGRSIADMVPEQVKSAITQELARYGSLKGALVPFEVPVRHRDGRELIVEIRPSLTGTSGKTGGFRGVAVDITERKKAEGALRRANRQLTLLTGITRHDILNKVAVILGFLRIAEKKNRDPMIGDYLKKIDTATTAIRSQLEFTRVYQDLGTHEPQWLALDEVIPRSQVPATIRLNTDVQNIAVLADPMLELVFFNLLDNAIRHGQRVSEIRVSSRRSGEDLVVVWEDNGVGIPENDKERIFVRGFGKNTGLGMFLVREILSLTGITITETGEPKKGARFEIVVPEGAYQMPGT